MSYKETSTEELLKETEFLIKELRKYLRKTKFENYLRDIELTIEYIDENLNILNGRKDLPVSKKCKIENFKTTLNKAKRKLRSSDILIDRRSKL